MKNDSGSSFLTTMGLLCRIGQGQKKRSNFSRTLFYLPVAGFLVTLPLYGIFIGGSEIVPDPFIVIVILTAVQYLLFNLFHFDGLLDSADALTPYVAKEKRVAILKDVHIGAFALFFGVLYLAVKLYVLTKGSFYFYIFSESIYGRAVLVLLFFLYPFSGRAAASLIPLVLKSAKEEGLGAVLRESGRGGGIGGFFVVFIPVAALTLYTFMKTGFPAPLLLLSFASVPITLLVVGALFGRKVGGFTGDTLGLAVETGEVLHIFIFYMLLVYGIA